MADTISSDDRALIAQALAEGRVTCVPRGVSGLPQYVCDPETGRLTTGMSDAAIRASQKARASRIWARRKRLQIAAIAAPKADDAAPGVSKKADQMRALLLDGLTPAKVAAQVGVETSYVYAIRSAMRASGQLPPGRPKAAFPALRAQALALFESGLSYAQVAERLGTTRQAVAGLVRRGRLDRAGVTYDR
jgi:hypothetical protein